MDVNAVNWSILTSLPEVSSLTWQLSYDLCRAYERAGQIYPVFDMPPDLASLAKLYPIDPGGVFVYLDMVKAETLTALDRQRYAQATFGLPPEVTESTRSSVYVDLALPDTKTTLLTSRRELSGWASSIVNRKAEFAVAQERGMLTQGIYRRGEALHIVVADLEAPQRDYVSGARISAQNFLSEIRSVQARIQSDLSELLAGH